MRNVSGSKLLIALGLVFAVVEGCKCDPAVGSLTPGICAKDTECPKGQVYRKGVCALERCDNRGDAPDADCCPGQICKNDGLCVDKVTRCSDNKDCGGGRSGRICAQRPNGDEGDLACIYPTPVNDECQAPYRRFNRRCIIELPCDGGCPDAEVCNIDTAECERVPEIPTAGSNCDVTCAPGTIKVYSDPDGMSFDQCCALACLCEALPPLSEGVYAPYASAAVMPSEILVASYNETYGDLVLSHHDKVTGKKLKLEFVDGTPAQSGEHQGDPTGPRGGVSEPGPNVGLYASLAIGADALPRIAYWDKDNLDLKYAEKTPEGWAIHVVDGDGEVGEYASMQFLAGRLRIVYFVAKAKSLAGQPGPFTTLRYAEAKTQNPRSASDWTLVDVIAPAPSRNPCDGQCTGSEVCLYVPEPPAKVCGTREMACEEPKPDGNPICAAPKGGMKGWYVEDPLPQAAVELRADGIGLYPAMVQRDDRLFITYYDNYTPPTPAPPFTIKTGVLKGVSAQLSMGVAGAFTPPITVDDGVMCDASVHDVGRFAFPAVAPNGRLGIAYQDKTNSASELRFYSPLTAADTFVPVVGCFELFKTVHNNNLISIADSGVDTASGGVTHVGADAYLHFDATSRPFIAYQDQTNLDVRVAAQRNDGKWYVDYLRNGQASGYDIQLLQEGSSLWLLDTTRAVDEASSNNVFTIIVKPITLPFVQ